MVRNQSISLRVLPWDDVCHQTFEIIENEERSKIKNKLIGAIKLGTIIYINKIRIGSKLSFLRYSTGESVMIVESF